MKLSNSKSHSLPIVGGVQGGHAHLNPSNHASPGIDVAMPLRTNMSSIGASKEEAKRPAIQAIKKGYGK